MDRQIAIDQITKNIKTKSMLKELKQEIALWKDLDQAKRNYLQHILDQENDRIISSIKWNQTELEIIERKANLKDRMKKVARKIFQALEQAPDKKIRNNEDEHQEYRFDWFVENNWVHLQIFSYYHESPYGWVSENSYKKNSFSIESIFEILETINEYYQEDVLNAEYEFVIYETIEVRREKKR